MNMYQASIDDRLRMVAKLDLFVARVPHRFALKPHRGERSAGKVRSSVVQNSIRQVCDFPLEVCKPVHFYLRAGKPLPCCASERFEWGCQDAA
jgi:hypothetical protein